ncbi:MAG TPA: NAD-dependent epimerase/dehydratase family protein [Candidatus Limnocylindria bacterium]|nr:NAD-dependent epimerase/dehydratase family protein [Candidatus Limnocylindria bacterium]
MKTPPATRVLSGARVVVTGGAGNVGSHIVDAAIAAGAREVVALDALVRGVPENLAPALATGKARLVEIDIRDREAVRANIRGADVVFHQAALRWTRCQEQPRECQEVMVDGTFNVLEAAAEAKVKRVVLASSAVVYGEPLRLPIDEDQPLHGTTVYGAAKAANEQMARAFAHLRDLPTTTLRYFNVYGPRMDVRSQYVEVMVRWLNLIDEGKPLSLFGDGSASVDFVYVGDVARANLLACETSAKDAIVNVCSGVETRMRDLAALLLELTGSRVGMEFKPQPPGALPARRYGDPRRAQELLGFRAETALADGVRQLIDWRRSQLAGAMTAKT